MDDRLTANQWVMIVPKCEEAVKCIPSKSDKYFVKKHGCQKEVKKLLCAAFDKLFAETEHVVTFWDDFAMNVTHKLGLRYRSREIASGKMEKYNEAQLQQIVLNPMMRELSEAACIIPNICDEAIKTDYLIQDDIQIVPNQPGQTPAVDALIQISKADGTIIACVPIKTKKDMNIKHYTQIACYINKLSTAQELTKFVTTGAIIDQRSFRLAFSVYCTEGEIPLPIVRISPPIKWKSENFCVVDQSALLTLACTFLTGQLERQEYMEEECCEISTDDLQGWGKLLQRIPHVIDDLERNVVEQEKMLNDLKRKVIEQEKMRNDLKRKLVELEQMLNDLERRW